MKNRYAILGASRGLGRALFENLIQTEPEAYFFLVSRKIQGTLPVNDPARVQILPFDFSVLPISESFTQALKDFNPTHLIYTAGGGPYGSFEKKKWADHQWALNVNFLFPSQLLHSISQSSKAQDSGLNQLKSFTVVGSSVAESQPDPLAASYAAAKHAVKGLVTTLQAEKSLPFALNLFSPGYMLTDMLPLNSAPRKENKAQSVERVAQQLVQIIHNAD